MNRDFAAFAEQNETTMETLGERPDLIELVEGYAEHHAGGLYVLAKPVAGGYLKLHDTWGPEQIEGEQTIVLHHYDPDTTTEDGRGFGPTEWVAHFQSGAQAVLAFLAFPEVTA